MGKGKGRQAGGFGSKAMQAQFQKEWKGHYNEEISLRRKQQKWNKKSAAGATGPTERPRLHLNSLRILLESRQMDDRREYESIREKSGGRSAKKRQVSEPGLTVYLHDDEYCREFLSEKKVKTLQMLALETLAPVLSEYLEQLGFDALHQYLSYLPGPALTHLSFLVSKSVGMTDSLLQLLGTHMQVTRLSIRPPKNDDEASGSWEALTSEGFCGLIPSWGHQSSIPDDWEEDSQEELDWRGCIRLQRLEVLSMPYLNADVLTDFLDVCQGITHLGLSGSLEFSSGPEVLWKLPEILPHLKFLDLSGNTWVTENLVWKLIDRYNLDHPQVLVIRAQGCLTPTQMVSLQLDYQDQISFGTEAQIEHVWF